MSNKENKTLEEVLDNFSNKYIIDAGTNWIIDKVTLSRDINNMFNQKLSELEKELEKEAREYDNPRDDYFKLYKVIDLEDAKRIINKFKENG